MSEGTSALTGVFAKGWALGGLLVSGAALESWRGDPWPGEVNRQRSELGNDGAGPAVCWRKAECWVELLQASTADALDALFNTYIKRVIISKSVSYANEWQLHLEEHPTV